jgi:hypothetical protein
MLESIAKVDERQSGCDVRNLTTHWTRAEIACLSSTTWMLFNIDSRRVNSGVRLFLRVNGVE